MLHNFWWWLGGFVSFPLLVVLAIWAYVAFDEWRFERRLKAPAPAEAPAQEVRSRQNYATHRWIGKRQCIPGEPDEYMRICDACGMEDRGDPAEFDITYPRCDGAGYLGGGAPGPAGINSTQLNELVDTDLPEEPILAPLSLELPRAGEWRRRHFDNVARLDRAAVLAAVEFLRGWMADSLDLVATLGKDNDRWWTEHHFFGMMAVRNALRSAGHGEPALGVDNLDDYAVGLVELAAGLTALCNSSTDDGIYCEHPAGHASYHTAVRGDLMNGVQHCWLQTACNIAVEPAA